MATREQIKQALDFLAMVTNDMPVLRVPLADLTLWATELGVNEVTLQQRYDGRVWANVCEYFGDKGLLVVGAIADVVRDVELPPCPEGAGFGQPVRLPVSEVDRLESFTSREQVA